MLVIVLVLMCVCFGATTSSSRQWRNMDCLSSAMDYAGIPGDPSTRQQHSDPSEMQSDSQAPRPPSDCAAPEVSFGTTNTYIHPTPKHYEHLDTILTHWNSDTKAGGGENMCFVDGVCIISLYKVCFCFVIFVISQNVI